MNKNGFTLIELIVVIIILGILAVTAAPKFINFSDDANQAKNAGFFAAFSSALKVTEAKAKVQGLSSSGRLTVAGTNQKIKLFNYWPECQAGTNATHCSDDDVEHDGGLSAAECTFVWNAIMNVPLDEYTVRGDNGNGWTCWFRLKDAPNIGFNYRAGRKLGDNYTRTLEKI
ncbi:MAG: prepilin-type N-terminal cleavage/methylation domain-containing protein [Parashewanella sp.]